MQWVKMQTWLQVRHHQHALNPSHSRSFPNNPDCRQYSLSQEGFAEWATLPSLSPPASQNSTCFSVHHEVGFLLLGQGGQDREPRMSVSPINTSTTESFLCWVQWSLLTCILPILCVKCVHAHIRKGDGGSEKCPVEPTGGKKHSRSDWGQTPSPVLLPRNHVPTRLQVYGNLATPKGTSEVSLFKSRL